MHRKVPQCSLLLLLLILVACQGAPQATPTTPPLADKLVFYYWADYLPQEILDAFTAEYGIEVEYRSYDTSDEAADEVRQGGYDVVAIENFKVPTLAGEGMLAPIDYNNIPNFRNVGANFRNLAYDPEGRYSVAYSWGVTGLVVHTDRVAEPILGWEALWNPVYKDQAGIWYLRRDIMGMTLLTLGYSVNSEEPAELEAALERMLALKQNTFEIEEELPHAASYLLEGEAAMVYGWSFDYQEALAGSEEVEFVLPEEGTILWGESLVIPVSSPNKATAELFIDFLLRPEMSALFTNETYTATSNEAARSLVDPALLADYSVFPPAEALGEAQILLPLSEEGLALHEAIWARFLDAPE